MASNRRLDWTFVDDRQAVAGQRDRRMVRIAEQDHVVDAKRGEDLRTRPVAANSVPRLGRLSGAQVERAR